MKKILTLTIIAIGVVGLSIQVASASLNIYGCTDPAAINYNPEATINDGTCEYDEPKGSITVCKIITDSENNIINGSDFPGTEFSITVAGQVITFTTPLTLNRSFWGDCSHEAQCIIISGLDITEYFYSEETYPLQGWEIPLYNDQFDVQIQSLDDFFIFDISNLNSDGHIVLTGQRPDRTLVILNKQKGGEDIPGCTDPEALNYNPEATVDDGSCIYEIPGCMDPVAINYNPEATVDDGSCEYEPPVIPGCTDPEALNYDPAATIDDGSCEYSPDLFSISGMKFNDQNDNGINDTEPGLIDWTIELYVSDQLFSSTITDTQGNYSFLNLDPGTYTVCELPQVGGWVQTYPLNNNGCHIVELIDTNLSGYDFGNHYQGYPILGCTDPAALNYNPEATVDDGTCIYEIPGCTEPAALNYNPQATVNDGSCRYGGSTRPRFSIIKTVAQEFVNAGEIANYTIVVECLGSGIARNTVLKDNLPEGLSYKNVTEDGEWELGDMMRGDKETVTFEIVVSEDAEAGKYINTAEVQASNSDKYKDTAELEVREIPVKGDEFFPELEIDKSVDKSSALAGSYVLFTIKIKNAGDAPAVNAVVRDTLPQGFIAEDGKSEIEWNISLLEQGETWERSFSVYIQSDVADGRYENVVVASAENHPQEVEDIAVVVLGSLPHTGTSISGLLKDWVGVTEPVSVIDYLIIPKIGVEIPIVQGSDDSALEKGAWLLPQTTTPDLLKNTALAAHRFKYRPPHKQTFYLLDKVSQGDDLLVYWKGEKYIYSVSSISIVNPDQTEVLADTEIPTLTLITCHPLFSDSSRLVVQGTLVI
ncbi:hypothetical protein AMJ47_03050 [Parcubacteria bacterium DG_72]|nr:MAG: hypothetical protein AMJ47_03050 [Parcubacteria bacterium DG_72]